VCTCGMAMQCQLSVLRAAPQVRAHLRRRAGVW
jgi:hypothetical protein